MRYLPIIFAALLLAACDSTGDRLEVPIPSADRYLSMEMTCLHATSTRDLIVGGYLTDVDGAIEGILLRSTDGGETWRRAGSMVYDFQNFLPQGIQFNDRRSGWVSGIRLRRGETIPVVLRTDDSAGHFRDVEIATNREAVVMSVSEIELTNDKVGRVHVVLEDPESGGIVTNVYESRDGGRSFVIESFSSDGSIPRRDPAQFFITTKEGFRILRPLENGTQVLEQTADGGKTWVPVSQFHLSQFPQYY